MASIRILIADDHRLFRQSLRELCVAKGTFDVVGEAENGQEAIALARHLQPDVILMDINMPEMNGVEATRLITQEYQSMRIIVLTIHHEDRYIRDAIQAGAYGYLLKKNIDAQELFSAIRIVHHGEALLDPTTTLQLLNDIRKRKGLSMTEQAPIESLTEGEKAVLCVVAQGLDNIEIASQLGLAKNTVANRLREVYQKIHVNSRTQAALWALRNGLASLD